ncbi:unnamed protein product, partial [Cladocopium goreaui]
VQWAEWGTGWTSAFVGARPVKAGYQMATCRRASEDELPEAPEGGRVIHVEYCMYCKFLPQYLKFRKAVADRFGERVLCFGNHEDTLQQLCRQPKARLGAFEVVDVKSNKVLYTKLGSGLHITERQEWMDQLFDEIDELCEKD